MGDRPVARPLPKHRTAQTQNNVHTHILNIHALSGIRAHDHSVRSREESYALDRAATVAGRKIKTHKNISYIAMTLAQISLDKLRHQSHWRPATAVLVNQRKSSAVICRPLRAIMPITAAARSKA
jgi:hypothetical protein